LARRHESDAKKETTVRIRGKCKRFVRATDQSRERLSIFSVSLEVSRRQVHPRSERIRPRDDPGPKHD
jgi:hypothetical protein